MKPAVIVALGATAARSLFGRAVTITKMRGADAGSPTAPTAFVTIHPVVAAAHPG